MAYIKKVLEFSFQKALINAKGFEIDSQNFPKFRPHHPVGTHYFNR